MKAATIATSGSFNGHVTVRPDPEQPAAVSGKLERPMLPNDGVVSRLMLQATSLAVIGSPFEKTRPLRSVKVSVELWFVSFQEVAWSGMTTFFEVISKS